MPNNTASVIGNRVWQAVQVQKSNAIWIGIGKTSAWTNENDAPLVASTTKALDELIVLKKAEVQKLVIPDPNGGIEVNKQKYTEVAPVDARTKDARYVYVAAWIKYDEAPTVNYRESGVFLDLVLKGTTPAGKLVVLPSEVQDLGYLSVVSNRKPVPHDVDTKEYLEFIIEY